MEINTIHEHPEPNGAMPKYHIPARFVTIIPKEFPASQTNSKKRKASTTNIPLPGANPRASPGASSKKSGSSNNASNNNNDMPGDALDSMIGEMGYADLVSNDSLDDLGHFDFDFS